MTTEMPGTMRHSPVLVLVRSFVLNACNRSDSIVSMKTRDPSALVLTGLFLTSLLVQCTRADTQIVPGSTENDIATNATNNFLGHLADSRVIGGVAIVQKDGKLAFAQGFGSASEVGHLRELN
jgi:hypothetical protein